MSVARKGLAALLAACVLLAWPGATPARAADPCDIPAEITSVKPMHHAARALAARKALRILVVGSASSTMPGTSAPAGGYPQKTAEALRSRLPGHDVSVQTRGGRGLTAADLAALLEAALPEYHPDLVVLQTGTVDAVNGVDPDEFERTLRAAADKVAAAGADLVLMDQQFSRMARATLNYPPFRQAMESTANAGEAMLLRRYELMRHWAETGLIDAERAPRRDWPRTTDRLHACLAQALAQAIARGIDDARR